MAGADYQHCNICGARLFYDAELYYIKYPAFIVCEECKEKYKIEIKRKKGNRSKKLLSKKEG